jgi:SAM-dependent methyltransferase
MSNSIPYTVPGTSQTLEASGTELRSADGRLRYPMVAGVPVIFPAGSRPTFDAYATSRRVVATSDEWQIESLAIDPPLQQRVRELVAAGGEHAIDPAVSYLIMATNGIAYEHKLGQLDDYPIPELPLGPGEGGRFLDIGCSWGRWCAAARRLGYQAYGIDPSLGAVLAARRVFRQLQLEGTFVCGDGRSLPFPDESFDVVYSYSVLQHFSDTDADAAWAEIARVLKPRGTALVQMANALGARSLFHLLRRGFRAPEIFDVRYRLPGQLQQYGERHVGATKLSVDCFLGLGLQKSDRHLYRGSARTAAAISESLKRVAEFVPPLKLVADSVFVRSTKPENSRNGNRQAHG